MSKHQTKRQSRRHQKRVKRVKVVKAPPRVGVAIALPKGTAPVLALHVEEGLLHVVPVPTAALKKSWWEKFMAWQGFDL
jgi:hypothetical protein